MSQFSTNNLLYLRNGWKQMGMCSEAFYKHWILFSTVWLSQGRTQGKAKCDKKNAHSLHEDCWKSFTHHRYIAISQKWLKIDGYMFRCVWQALNPLFIHVKFTAIVPGAYPGEAKMCLRLSWGSQMPPPAKRVKATTYRRDSWGSHTLHKSIIYTQF